jgi:transposase
MARNIACVTLCARSANHHLIVMHEVTNDGTDRSRLSHVADETKAALGVEKLDAVRQL